MSTGPTGPSFAEVWEKVVMVRGCNIALCHGGGIGGLEMPDQETAYMNLVGMPAAVPKCGQTIRVVPGSLDESIVWYRVRPAAMDMGMPCASKMPEGSMGLTDEEAQLFSDWVLGGAQP